MSTTSVPPLLDSETSTLFNPAFCALMLNRASAGYEAQAAGPMPVTFAFLILPSALHKPTRDGLPRTIASSMWSWLRTNPVLLMDFAERVRAFRAFTAAALTYGLEHTVLAGSLGSIAAGPIARRPNTLHPTGDWLACLDAAGFLGKWFGRSDTDEATVLAQWGVRP